MAWLILAIVGSLCGKEPMSAVQGQPKYPAGLALEELFVVEGILEGMIEVGRGPIEEDSLGNSQGKSDLSQMWLRSLVSQAQWRLWGMGAS